VVQVRQKTTGDVYAMKILNKKTLLTEVKWNTPKRKGTF